MTKPRHNAPQVRKAMARFFSEYDARKAEAVGEVLVQTLERGQRISPMKTGRFAASIHMTTDDKPQTRYPRGDRWNRGRSFAQMRENKQAALRIIESLKGRRAMSIRFFSNAPHAHLVEKGWTLTRGPNAGQRIPGNNVFRKMQTWMQSRLKRVGMEMRKNA